jgi:hypothetical protein
LVGLQRKFDRELEKLSEHALDELQTADRHREGANQYSKAVQEQKPQRTPRLSRVCQPVLLKLFEQRGQVKVDLVSEILSQAAQQLDQIQTQVLSLLYTHVKNIYYFVESIYFLSKSYYIKTFLKLSKKY